MTIFWFDSKNPYFVVLTIVMTTEKYQGEAEQLLFGGGRLQNYCQGNEMQEYFERD